MRRWILPIGALILLSGAAFAMHSFLYSAGPDIPVLGLKHHGEVAAMCPWRQPDADMHAFFPGSTAYHTDFLIFSHDRMRILQLLGPDSPLMSTSLYVHRIVEGTLPRGSIVVQRVAGPHGALEVVVGLGTDGRIAGARIQRLREPENIAELITSRNWLAGFIGKSSDSPLQIGTDLPAVPSSALPAAKTVARTIRTLVIETDFARLHKS